jgi:MFS family permease
MPVLWLGLHLVRMASSLVGGRWTDARGPRMVIASGWLWYALIYALLAFAESPWLVIPLVLLYGVSHGLSEAAEKSWVASLAPSDQQGTWFGWFHLTVGLFTLPASLVFGWLWDQHGSSTAFLAGASLGLVAVLLLLIFSPARGGRITA